MKSFCVLNEQQDDSTYERVGSAACELFSGKIGVACDGGDAAFRVISLVASGVAKSGRRAVDFGCINESRIPFLLLNYRLSAVIFVSCGFFVRFYSVDSNQTESNIKELLSGLLSSDEVFLSDGGEVIDINSDLSYFSALLAAAESLEDTVSCIVSRNADIKGALCSVINRAGGDLASKPKLFLSASGLCVSAADEQGNILKHSNLLEICSVCHLETGADLTVPFYASPKLELIAASSGAKLKRSFDAGPEMWQNDGLFLAVELLKNMSRYGMGLCSMSKRVGTSAVVRKNLRCSMSVDALADIIPCEEMVTDGRSIYARIGGGQVLLTHSAVHGSYCMEASCADSETAAELSGKIANLLSS